MDSNLVKRLISAFFGIILFLVIVFSTSMVLDVAIGILILIMLWEVYHAFGYGWKFASLGCVGSGVIVGALSFQNIDSFIGCLVIYTMFLVLFAVLSNGKIKFSDVAVMMFVTIYIACFMFYVSRTRRLDNGLYYIFLIFICAWINDSAAYFAGKAFGKHKLAELISPKKTLEGAVGGLIGSALGAVILGLIAQFVFGKEVNYPGLALIGLVGAVLAVIGDLIASIMKRESGIKDFGTIMPGHGGALDRFDSVILVAPFIYYAVTLLNKMSLFVIR